MSIDAIADAAAGPFAAACVLLVFAGRRSCGARSAPGPRPPRSGSRRPPPRSAPSARSSRVAAAAGLVFGGWAAAAVAVVYAALAIAAWRLFVSAPGTACGCLGVSDAPVSALHIWVNLAAASRGRARVAAGPPLAAVGSSMWARLAFVLLVGCCAALVATALDALPAVRRDDAR